MKNIDKNFFPGWTRKSITFTIDDGNVKYDSQFLDIVKPKGILGTFNLCSHLTSSLTPEEYREFYRGYEISNHMKYHPTAIPDGDKVTVSDEPFDPMTSAESTEGRLVSAKSTYCASEKPLSSGVVSAHALSASAHWAIFAR